MLLTNLNVDIEKTELVIIEIVVMLVDISKIVNMLNTNASKNNTNAENKISSTPLGGFDLNSIMRIRIFSSCRSQWE